MYLNHYKLKLKPFQISTDPRFLWLGENHKEAFAVLKYGILDNRGFLLLTGDVGTGKTTLIHALVNSLGDEVITATVPDPNLKVIDFLNYIANAFGITEQFSSKGEFISRFRTFLCDVYDRNKRTLLIIDEAQLLKHEVLEEIRLLSNIEKQNTKLLNIFFVGQNEFNDLLWEDRNRALRQRITVNYNVYALSMKETGEYIRHRLKVAGTTKKIFTDSAIREIVEFSEGFPRTINIICDHALLSGFVKGVNKIDDHIVRDCIKDIRIPRSKPAEKTITSHAPAFIFESVDSEEKKTVQSPEEMSSGNKKIWYKYAAAYSALFVIAFYIMGYLFEAPIILKLNRSINNLGFGTSSSEVAAEAEKQNDQKGIPIQSPKKQEVNIKDEMKTEQKLPTLVVSKDSQDITANAQKDRSEVKTDLEAEDKADTVEKTIEISMIDKSDSSSITPGPDVASIDAIENQMTKEDKNVIDLLRGKVIVNFSHNSNEVSEDAEEILEKIAKILIKYPDLKVGVIGYTDSSGIYSYNKSLSRFRANIVKSYLTGKGATSEQITAIGMGPQNPIETNSTWEGRKTNRRVEIVLYEDSREHLTN